MGHKRQKNLGTEYDKWNILFFIASKTRPLIGQIGQFYEGKKSAKLRFRCFCKRSCNNLILWGVVVPLFLRIPKRRPHGGFPHDCAKSQCIFCSINFWCCWSKRDLVLHIYKKSCETLFTSPKGNFGEHFLYWKLVRKIEKAINLFEVSKESLNLFFRAWIPSEFWIWISRACSETTTIRKKRAKFKHRKNGISESML